MVSAAPGQGIYLSKFKARSSQVKTGPARRFQLSGGLTLHRLNHLVDRRLGGVETVAPIVGDARPERRILLLDLEPVDREVRQAIDAVVHQLGGLFLAPTVQRLVRVLGLLSAISRAPFLPAG